MLKWECHIKRKVSFINDLINFIVIAQTRPTLKVEEKTTTFGQLENATKIGEISNEVYGAHNISRNKTFEGKTFV